ncbi:MAG: sigma-70 family RNA polymerase sigma factor [Nitrospira sp.]|nr:sigma-70 family RNA polymerase sigma factor [Nitrospira sp.]MDR4487443.1 sigma-70 family RNA polymerase sigma factor [Nitrospirales bacterium]
MFISLNIEALFHSYHRSLVVYLRHLMKCPDSAEEIAQDTYLRLQTHAPSGKITHPRAYLFRTAHNLAMDQLAKHVTEGKYRTHGDIHQEMASLAPEPDRIAESRERLALIAEALNELPPPCRQAFMLNKFHYLTHAEIAIHLGVSQSMVEKHLMRALSHCRTRLKHPKRSPAY